MSTTRLGFSQSIGPRVAGSVARAGKTSTGAVIVDPPDGDENADH